MGDQTSRLDVLIAGARVVDGTGNPWLHGDVALAGDRIAAVAPAGRIECAAAREAVDGTGLVVCPGFIDIQSHSIVACLTDRRSLSKVTQGVTTEIMGEGWTPAPFGGRVANPVPEELRSRLGHAYDEWNERARGWTRFGDWLVDLEQRGIAVNVGSFVGGGTIREYGKGYAPRSRLYVQCSRVGHHQRGRSGGASRARRRLSQQFPTWGKNEAGRGSSPGRRFVLRYDAERIGSGSPRNPAEP